MCGLVLNNSGKLFGILASEGGTALDDVTLSNLASQIGSAGGGVYTNPVVGSGVRGTQGQWSLALPTNFANANTATKKCDGTAGAVTLTAGRPVVALWQGIGLNNQDLLYRKSVTGQPQLNQMNTPLGLWVDSAGTTVVAAAACTTNGAMAADATGKPFICQSNAWSAVNSSTTAYWKQPVANYASLPASGNSVGDGRITTDTYRGYSWNGSGWAALAVDQNGNLTMSGNLTANTLIPTATVTQGTACSPNGAIAKDSTGLTLSCQSGGWQQATQGPRAWVSFDGSSCSPLCPIFSQWNVSSVIKGGPGQYWVYFQTPMANSSYAAFASISTGSGLTGMTTLIDQRTTAGVRVVGLTGPYVGQTFFDATQLSVQVF